MGKNASGSPTRPSLLLRIGDPGDTQAGQTFVDVYGPLIYRHARSQGLQDADAAELTQEVLFQVSRSIHRFEYRPGQARFRDWLGMVTENKIRNFCTRQAGTVRAEGGTGTSDALAGLAAPARDTGWE